MTNEPHNERDPDPDSLQEYTKVVLREAEEAKKAEGKNGRSEKGRHLAVLVTKLEEAAAWAAYHGL